jgi:DNA uptake protein ComE-like DNA-binding protein
MIRVLSITTFALLLSGCAPGNTDALQQHTADVTAAAKRDAEAITRGVAQGLVRKEPLDINAASDKDLAKLPGVTPEIATTIIAKRPYVAAHDLVRKRVISTAEFDKIKNQIVVK